MKIIVDGPEYTYYDFVIKTGAVEPNITAQLTNNNDLPIDLTGASVRFKMAEPGGSIVIDKKAQISEPVQGRVVYSWVESDTSTDGQYNAEFAVDYDGNTGSQFDADSFFPSDEFMSVHIMDSL